MGPENSRFYPIPGDSSAAGPAMTPECHFLKKRLPGFTWFYPDDTFSFFFPFVFISWRLITQTKLFLVGAQVLKLNSLDRFFVFKIFFVFCFFVFQTAVGLNCSDTLTVGQPREKSAGEGMGRADVGVHLSPLCSRLGAGRLDSRLQA